MAAKIFGIILTIAGAIGLVLGVLGIFGTNLVALNAWALAILGFVFFVSGIGLVKKDASARGNNTSNTQNTSTSE